MVLALEPGFGSRILVVAASPAATTATSATAPVKEPDQPEGYPGKSMPQRPQKREKFEAGQEDGEGDKQQGQAREYRYFIPVFHGRWGLSGR